MKRIGKSPAKAAFRSRPLVASTIIGLLLLTFTITGAQAAEFSFFESVKSFLGLQTTQTAPATAKMATDNKPTPTRTEDFLLGNANKSAIDILLPQASPNAPLTSLLYEPFSYNSGSNLGGQGGWTNANSGDEVVLTAGNLTYAGLAASQGNKVEFGGAGIDPQKTFNFQASGTVYYSFLLNVTNLGSLNTTGGYIAGFRGGASTVFGGTLFLRSATGGYNIGIAPRTNTTTPPIAYSPTVYTTNTTYLVVVSYQFVSSGTADDVVNLYVNPTSLGGAAPAMPSATVTNTTGGTADLISIDGFFLRQDSTTGTPAALAVDEVRAATTYAEVTPLDTTPPTVTSIDDGDADNTVGTNTTLTYTVTFSEDIDASTVTAADFDNAGTSAITIGTIAETTATSGVFTVQVTPTTAGTVILRIPTGAVISDISGNNLAVPVSDDTSVTVNVTAPTTQASNITFSGTSYNQTTANWTNGNGAGRVVYINNSNTFSTPSDGSSPTANNVYGGSGEQVVYNGTGSSVTVTNLSPATQYYFRVYEYNGAGATTVYNTTPTANNPNSVTTTADTTPPDTTITSNPPNPSNSASATFTFTGTDDVGVVAIECSLDGGSYDGCGSQVTFNGLSDGSHTLLVRARDAANNVDPTPASYTWTIDTTAPVAPFVVTPADNSTVTTTQPTVSGTAEPLSSVTIVLDSGALTYTTSADGSGNFSLMIPSPLSETTHTVKAYATDAANNQSPDSNTNTFTVDATAPAVSSINRANADPTAPGSSVDFTVTFSENVTGVDASDFALTTTGVSGASITGVSGSNLTYTVTVNTGSGTGTVRLDVIDNDSIIDGAGNPLGGAGAGNGNYTNGQIYTVDAPGTLQFSDANYNVNENDGTVTITVTRTGGSSGAASVSYATSNGTAAEPGDYSAASGTLNWADGNSTPKTFTVAITDDAQFEPTETFNLTLDNATGASLSGLTAATVTILDNDTRPLPNTVYVDDDWTGTTVGTDPDGAGPATEFGYDAFATVQGGVDGVAANGTVNVLAGTYHEDVNVNKQINLHGAGAATTTISGAIGGSSIATIFVTASGVNVDGFTVTRDGNNTTDWNDPGLNTTGFAIQGLATTGAVIHDNIITGNRTGIDINNSGGHTIRNNSIDFNRTGMILRNQNDGLTIVENFITNNWTVGVLFLDGSVPTGSNNPAQSATNSVFSNNDISGNWYGQVADRQTGGSLPAPGAIPKDFRFNWWGTTTPVVTTANTTEPGYAAQIPTAYGGMASAPGGQPDIAGPASANIKYLPLLQSGTDTNVETVPGRGTFGFQGASSTVTVKPSDTSGWGFLTETPNGTGSFLGGPAIPPLGVGSARLTVDADGGQILGKLDYAGIRIAQITQLVYSTYQYNNASTGAAISLQFQMDEDLNDGNTAFQGRLTFEPSNDPNQPVQQGVWQTWNVLSPTAKFWASPNANSTVDEACPQSLPCTLAQVLAAYPNIGIHANPNLGAVIFKVGSGIGSPFVGNVDALTIGFNNGPTTTYDFEPEPEFDAPVIAYTAFSNTPSTGNRTLSVTITDATGVWSAGTLVPRIYYNKNGGSYTSGACSLTSGSEQNGTWDCPINNAQIGGVAIGDSINYFVIAQDVFGNVASNPSGATATDVNNVTAPPPTPNNYTIYEIFAATIAKQFAPASIQVGGQSTVTLTLTNSNTMDELTNASFTDNLVNMSAVGGAVGGDCAGTTPASLTAGATNLSFSGITIPAGSICTVTFAVTSSVAGAHPNATSGVTTSETPTAGAPSNSVNLTVVAPPQIAKSFSPDTIVVNGVSTLQITITNPAANTVALTGVGVVDNFPAGIEVDATPAETNGCPTGSTFAPTAGATSISISDVTVPINSACTFTVKVKGTSAGAKLNTTDAVTSANGGTGETASATLTVNNPSISGTITYGTTPLNDPTKFVPGVLTSASGASSASDTTDSSGNYLIGNLNPGGQYTVTPTKSGNANGISSFDATLVLRCVAAGNACSLSANQQQAAETDGSSGITSFDAVLILRYVAGNGSGPTTGQVGNWKFLPQNRDYPALNADETAQDYTAILLGELDGDWTASGMLHESAAQQETDTVLVKRDEPSVISNGGAATALVPEQREQELAVSSEKIEKVSKGEAEVQISMPENISATAGNIVKIPVLLANERGRQISAYSFAVRFDPNVLQADAEAIEAADSLSAKGFTIVFDTNTKGRIGVAAISLNNSVSTTGTLLYLRLRVVGSAGSATALSFEARNRGGGTFEDGVGNKLSAASTNGSLTTAAAQTSASINLSGRVLTADGRGIRNVLVSLTDESGRTRTVLTSAFGYYRFADAAAGQNYTISVSAKKFSFSRASQTLAAAGEIGEINFVADF